MKFAAIIEYTQDKEKVTHGRPSHRQYLTKLKDLGQMVLCGPFTDDSGALIVYEAETPEAAEALITGDPFHAHGVFLNWKLRPWNIVMANKSLLPG